jgi:hypothetical protein
MSHKSWPVIEMEIHQQVFSNRECASTSAAHASLSVIATDPARTCKHIKPTAVFMDIEKAFRRVGHPITEALIKKEVCRRMLFWLSDYLLNITYKLTFKNGTPQGSILSPTLFNLLMDKLVNLPFIQTVHAVSYADNITILAADGPGKEWQSNIQQALDLMSSACTYWGLKILPAESRVMQSRPG